MKKRLIPILAMLVIIFSLGIYSNVSNDFQPNLENTYLVTRIVDGDTIEINYNSTTEKVRMIGIDTPETVKPNTEVQPYGKEASAFTKSMLLNKYVSLEFDEQERDKYNRLLAYVYIDDVMYNKTLLEKGLAHVATFPPNIKYVEDFIQIEAQAKSDKIGLWEFYTDETVSEVNAEYIANSSSKKIHLLSCTYGKNIAIYNKEYFDNLDYPLANGYEKCSYCLKD